jgi:hypothetical protein
VQVVRGLTVTDYEALPHEMDYLVRTKGPSFQAPTLFLATGKCDNPKSHRREGVENSDIGFKIHLRLAAKAKAKLGSGVDLFFFCGGYAGLCSVEDGLANLCFIIDKRIFALVGGRFQSALTFLEHQSHDLKAMLEGAQFEMSRPVTTANIPYGYIHHPCEEKHGRKTLYYLGDQFAVIPSFTGVGMSLAFLTGERAAEDFHRIRSERLSDPFPYEEGLYQVVRSAMKVAYPIHGMTQSPTVADGMILLLKMFPSLTRRVLDTTKISTNALVELSQ